MHRQEAQWHEDGGHESEFLIIKMVQRVLPCQVMQKKNRTVFAMSAPHKQCQSSPSPLESIGRKTNVRCIRNVLGRVGVMKHLSGVSRHIQQRSSQFLRCHRQMTETSKLPVSGRECQNCVSLKAQGGTDWCVVVSPSFGGTQAARARPVVQEQQWGHDVRDFHLGDKDEPDLVSDALQRDLEHNVNQRWEVARCSPLGILLQMACTSAGVAVNSTLLAITAHTHERGVLGTRGHVGKRSRTNMPRSGRSCHDQRARQGVGPRRDPCS